MWLRSEIQKVLPKRRGAISYAASVARRISLEWREAIGGEFDARSVRQCFPGLDLRGQTS